MHRRLTKLLVLVAALALLAFGATSLASGGSKPTPLKAKPAAHAMVAKTTSLKSNRAVHAKVAADGDNIQAGDQSAPDTAATAAEGTSPAEAPSSESAATDGDQAAQDAACKAAGVDSNGANVQYDGTTCTNGG